MQEMMMKSKYYHCLLFICLLCIIFFVDAGAETYRWLDEHGRVHYGDRPPDQQTETTLIEHRGITQAEQRAKALYSPQDALRERLEESQVREYERAEERKLQRAQLARQQQQKQACATLRQEMDDLRNPRWRLYLENEQGERDFLSAQQRKTLYQERELLLREYHCP